MQPQNSLSAIPERIELIDFYTECRKAERSHVNHLLELTA